MKRKIFNVREVNKEEANIMNSMFDELYKFKKEEVVHRNSAGTLVIQSYRESETGRLVLSPVSSTSLSTTVAFSKKYSDILNISLTPIGASAFSSWVSSFTASEMVIKIDATSTAVTAKIDYKITGTLE